MIGTGERWYATGKRKSAVARVWITKGTGQVHIRKWRKVAKGTDLTVTYTNKAGELVEEKAQFSPNLKDGEYGVPFTAKAGKKPFRFTPMNEYFGRETLRMLVEQAFQTSETEGQFDVYAIVKGGGLAGQAGAIRHGISRALCAYELSQIGTTTTVETNAEGEEVEVVVNNPIRRSLKRAGFLTRDARVKERKKYGQPGARKRYQFSKR